MSVTCRDGNCYVIDTFNWKVIAKLSTRFGAATCSAWTHCCRILAVGGQDDAVALYSTSTYTRLAYLTGPQNWVSSISITPMKPDGGITLFSSCLDGRLYLWDIDAKGLVGDIEASPTLSPTQVQLSETSTIPSDVIFEGGVATVPPPTYSTQPAVPEIDPSLALDRLHTGTPLLGVTHFPDGGIATSCSNGILQLWYPRDSPEPPNTHQNGHEAPRPPAMSLPPRKEVPPI
eukprot:TRINITY_DN16808_c0_g1_i1.p1 TRINITY_DN16808_c0_g1~~TRINITY_DN16808_c0_g1_i1.p1  ORF type:complete len:268 (+),score=14.39 TRINITY_DN16808_c0_g1_i1:111-806(+)